ncbi:hypothetical protein HanRHA438_Chr09g0380651 [Helianthus annuus]|nr:hypothetical protein HanIR_Chr09g0398181 [Helianthus annuus]KAJ0541006.1 hypothetical protein HanHA89_Chr09g0323501 [Helianthus annuus]KAJ0710214.1 hypothetical protein HanOQP8_Chr09g0309751 [Helianthus annuus]KAJ0886547.1 hypothetical protein HanRHA438_Chr09g0380651 [Helianthus annuus]
MWFASGDGGNFEIQPTSMYLVEVLIVGNGGCVMVCKAYRLLVSVRLLTTIVSLFVD